jgi:hypothetical protein
LRGTSGIGELALAHVRELKRDDDGHPHEFLQKVPEKIRNTMPLLGLARESRG